MFKTNDQQDAHDFYTFLVDNLHEETNIKSGRKKYDVKEESDTIDTSEYELSNEYWANTIRQNASYIYD
jgi:ubiquitin C-terminal hydrolase